MQLFAAGEDDGIGFKEGAVPGEGGPGFDMELADSGDGAAGEGGDGGLLAGEGEGDVADDAGGGAEVAGGQDEAVGCGGFDDEELLAGAGADSEEAGDGCGIAVLDGDADGGGGGGILRGGSGGEGVGAGVLRGLGMGEWEDGGEEGDGDDEGDAHGSLFDADGGDLRREGLSRGARTAFIGNYPRGMAKLRFRYGQFPVA